MQAKERCSQSERFYNDSTVEFENPRIKNPKRLCLPESYDVERIISSKGTGEVCMFFCLLSLYIYILSLMLIYNVTVVPSYIRRIQITYLMGHLR